MHIHVSCPQGEAKFWIFPLIALAGHTGLSARELSRMQDLVAEHKNDILRSWKAHFGEV